MANIGTNWSILIGNFGFPIVITIYLLVHFEKKIEALTSAIQDLKEVKASGEQITWDIYIIYSKECTKEAMKLS